MRQSPFRGTFTRKKAPFSKALKAAMYRVSPWLFTFALALAAGLIGATLWVNLDPATYFDFAEYRFSDMPFPFAPLGSSLTLQILIADFGMAFFLFYLGKELWEAAVIERGALRQGFGLLPLLGALGGLAGAAGVWVLAAALLPQGEEPLGGAWPIALGPDVLLSYLFARRLFGPAHPVVPFLLMLLIAMNVFGLCLAGLAALSLSPRLLWLALPLGAAGFAWWMGAHRLRVQMSERARRQAGQLWPYLLAGFLSWLGVAAAGLPPALGFLPVLPFIPHARHAFGLFAEAEGFLTDPLNRLTQHLLWLLVPVLFLFGLSQGGIEWDAAAAPTPLILAAFWIGKPLGLGLVFFGLAPLLRLRLPKRLRRRDLGLAALLSGIGFSLPILSFDPSLPGGYLQEAARLGLGLSLLAGPGAVLLGRVMGLRRP